MITPKALTYFPNANMRFVSPKEMQCLQCEIKALKTKVTSLETGTAVPDNIVTEPELNAYLKDYFVDAFGVPIN